MVEQRSQPLERLDAQILFRIADASDRPNRGAVIGRRRCNPAANQHRSGVLVESLTVASMIETLAVNVPQIARVKIMVDGKERDTLSGHADLMGTYNVSDVHALVKAMQ